MQLTLALPLLSLALGLALTPAWIHLARRIGWVDHPGHRKLHAKSMPVVGGIAILIAALPSLILLLRSLPDQPGALRKVALVAGAGLAAGLLGLIDDRRALRGRHKVIVQALIALAFTSIGFRFVQLDLPALEPVPLGVFAVPITMVFMIAVCNAVNLIDGVDGLAASVIATSLLAVAASARFLRDPTTMLLCLAVLGAVLGVLRYNWAPARLYLGDAGSLGLGMFAAAAILAIGQEPGPPGAVPLVSPPWPHFFFAYRIPLSVLLVLYPLLEISLSALRRAVKGKAIARADNDHIHHCLLRRSWTAPAIAQGAATISALAAAGVYARVQHFDTIAALLWTIDGLLIGVLLHHCGYLEQFFLGHLRSARPAFRMSEHFASMQRLKVGSTTTAAEVLALICQACSELGVERLRLHAVGADGQVGSLTWPPRDPRAAALEPTEPFDRAVLCDDEAWAAWELHGERPHDLEMEHRLLFDELIRDALERLRVLPGGSLPAIAADAVTCHAFSGRDSGRENDAPPPRSPRAEEQEHAAPPAALDLPLARTSTHTAGKAR